MPLTSMTRRDDAGFAICERNFLCEICRDEFVWLKSEDDLLVKLECSDGVVRWMATYGQGGYRHLLEQLVPGFSRRQLITATVARKFEEAFRTLQQQDCLPFECFLGRGPRCLNCGSNDLRIEAETVTLHASLEFVFADG